MKKLFTLLVTALVAVSASAQLDVVKLFTKDGNTYKLPSNAQEIADFAAAYPDYATLFWGVDPMFPADVPLNEDQSDIVISGVTTVSVGTHYNLKKDDQNIKAYINCGSTLGNTINPEKDITEDVTLWDTGSSQSILRVVTKKAGKLAFDVYSGTNNRSIGIYQTPTEEELNNELTGKWLDVQSFNDAELHTSSADVEAGREYILVCSSKGNQNLMEIRFEPTEEPVAEAIKLFKKDGIRYVLPSNAQEIADFTAAYPDYATLFWGVDPMFPADMALNEDQTDIIISGVTTVSVGTHYNLLKEDQNIKAYINMGSTLGNTINPETDITEDVTLWDTGSNQSILRVVTKKAGNLAFDVYSGKNNRSIGIYQTPTEEELNNELTGKWLDVQSYRDEETMLLHTTSANVEAGREYILVCSSKGNQNLMEIRFDTAGGTGINTIGTSSEKTIEAIYTLGGMRTNEFSKGVNIVKYSDGTTVKILK
ncbi:MAG: hypothetical protein J6C31_03920 [Prevotella sp.]|nr:hypothetical protein [Prevotella sp.]